MRLYSVLTRKEFNLIYDKLFSEEAVLDVGMSQVKNGVLLLDFESDYSSFSYSMLGIYDFRLRHLNGVDVCFLSIFQRLRLRRGVRKITNREKHKKHFKGFYEAKGNLNKVLKSLQKQQHDKDFNEKVEKSVK